MSYSIIENWMVLELLRVPKKVASCRRPFLPIPTKASHPESCNRPLQQHRVGPIWWANTSWTPSELQSQAPKVEVSVFVVFPGWWLDSYTYLVCLFHPKSMACFINLSVTFLKKCSNGTRVTTNDLSTTGQPESGWGFYVRNHFPVPSWDNVEEDYDFEVTTSSGLTACSGSVYLVACLLEKMCFSLRLYEYVLT